MVQKELEILNKLGLHARAAAKFVRRASEFDCDIQVGKDAMTVNGKSIIGVLLLAAPQGSHILVSTDGSDEDDAMNALVQLVATRFGEE
ncbi:MAG: HPr family phosphocarrier protein [Acidobacteria bacterium]|nr:HPr family phosphocarrier protein [Acidobacteriota bacterium]